MARIAGATLLIIVLINCFSDRAARCDEFRSAGFTTMEIRKCRCSKTQSNRIKCPKPLIPINHKVKQDLKHCLCCRNDRNIPALYVVLDGQLSHVRAGGSGSAKDQGGALACVNGTKTWETVNNICGYFVFCCLPVFTCKVTSAVGACPCLPLLDCISCVFPSSLAMRKSVRARYSIQGSVWSDCLYGCCCYPLAWLKISRELNRRAASYASASSSSLARYTTLTSLQGAHLV